MFDGKRLLPAVLAVLPLTGAACWLAPAARADGGPVLVACDVPTVVTADVPATFDVTLTDDAGTIGTINWNFGDGTAGSTGADTSHAWAAPGIYLVTISTVDSIGLTLTESVPVTVTAPPATPASTTTAVPTPAPTLGATQSRSSWTAAQGTVFTLSLSARADVTMTFARAGSDAGSATARPLGTLAANVLPGGRRIGFHGLLSAGHQLKTGRYVVTLVASAGGVSSAPAALDFSIKHPSPARKTPKKGH